MAWPPLPPISEVVDLAWRVVLPAGGTAFVAPLAARLAFGPKALPVATVIGAAGGLAWAFALREPVPWKPEDFGSRWMHVAWAFALAAGLLAAMLPWFVNWLPKLAAVAAAVWALLPDDRRTDLWWIGGLSAAMALPWLLAAPSSKKDSQPAWPWPERALWLLLALAALSVVALYSSYLRIVDFSLMTACALFGGGLACALLRRDSRELESLGYVTLPALALFLVTEAETSIPTPAYFCAGLAAVPLAFGRWLPDKWWASLVRGALVSIPAAVAVGFAMAYGEVSFG